MRSTELPVAVPIALLYQQAALHEHLKHALGELGARVVYDAPAASFDRARLAASGARVVVVNLDPEVEEELEHLYALLEDDSLNVIFNDAEVSSQLEGWDQARWARHLAAKILGIGDTNPPRPAGAEAVAVRVRAAGPDRPGSAAPDLGFDLMGAEFDRALHADTAASLSRERAQLTTNDEPVPAELIDPERKFERAPDPAKADAPTLELPRPTLGDDRPTLKLPRVAAVPEPAATEPAIEDDAFSTLSLDIAPAEAGLTDRVVDTLDGDADELAATLDAIGFDLDAPLGAVADSDADSESIELATDAAADDEFAGAFGAFDVSGLDETPSPDQRDAAPPPGLDELLLGLPKTGDDARTADAPAAPARAAAPAARAPAAASRLSLADATETEPAAPAGGRPAADLSRFDLSHLSLAPLEGEEPVPVPAGRAQFRIDTADRRPVTPPPASDAPRAVSSGPEPPASDEFDLGALDFEPLAEPVGTSIGTDAGLAVEEFGDQDLTAASGDADLFAGFERLLGGEADAEAAPAPARALRCWVLGGSIGGPDAVREFLAQVPADADVVFLLAQHMGADFVDLMVQQLARATALGVRLAADGTRARPGEVIVVPLSGRLLLAPDGQMRIAAGGEPGPYSPSIDQVLHDVADRFGADSGAIIFSGMAQDAVDGARYLAGRGGQVWAQDPATCVISSMVDGAVEAGVVSVVAAPAELGRRFVHEVLGRA